MKTEDVLQQTFQDNYDKLSDTEKEELHELFRDPELISEIKEKLESIIFIHKPPTPEEFLDHKKGFLPKDYIDGLYSYIKKDFIQAMKRNNPYSIISIYGSTRTGKSVLARLFSIYSIIFVSYLRDPHTYFKINKMSRICGYLVSFKREKTNQIYLSPLLDILAASDKFQNERFEANVYKKGVNSKGVIHYSEASKFGDITFPKMYIVTGKDASSLVGADIIFGAVSELTFFKQYAVGMTDEMIAQVFTKLYSRIQSTVGFGTFPCWSYIDSSANDADSPIEKMILEDLKENDITFFRHYIVWKLRPHLYPIYNETGKTFKLYLGDGNKTAHIINLEKEDLNELNPAKIMDVPIDLLDTFKRSLTESIRDLAGQPTQKENKFISDYIYINNVFRYDNYLDNIEGIIIADSADDPKNLIFPHIQHYFSSYGPNKVAIKRAPHEPRFIGFDLAHSAKGDILGITMLHKEWSIEMEHIVYVTDFSFAVGPGKEGINLSALKELIIDIMIKGHVTIQTISSDSYQNALMMQDFKRDGINVITMSIEKSLEPYLNFLNKLIGGYIIAGKNIFLKNNLKSLQLTKTDKGKEKVDHTYGDTNNQYYGDWVNSTCGINANDVADSMCHALYQATEDPVKPSTIFEKENKKLDIVDYQQKNEFVEEAYHKLHTFY